MFATIATVAIGRINALEKGRFFVDGWIKLHRKVADNPIFKRDLTAWHVFEVILLYADKDNGSWSGGRFQIAELSGCNPNTVYKALQRLKTAGMVTLSSNNRFTTIHICNWQKYQTGGNSKVTTFGNNKVTTGEHSNKNKELRNINNTPLPPKGEARAVVEFYNDVFGRKVIPTDGRMRKIAVRLKTFTLEQVKQAITNAANDEFFNGGGARGWVGDLDYLIRSDENLEKYCNLGAPQQQITQEMIAAYV